MESRDDAIEIDSLERLLLPGAPSNENIVGEDEPVLYSASFEEMEDNYLKYQTSQWVLYSLLLILAWGIGLLMLIYIPIRRYVLRKDFRSRKLYVTPNAIVYKVTRPAPFPCFGVLKKEKHVLLPSVANVVIEQGYFQSLFGIYSIRIENVGVRRPAGDDVHIQGIADPTTLRKVVLTRLASMRGKRFNRLVSANNEDVLSSSSIYPSGAQTGIYPGSVCSNSEEMILHRIEELQSSIKRVQALIKGKHPGRTSEPLNQSK